MARTVEGSPYPPGSETPIHDHLAWGLVGLYRGTQEEDVYAPSGDGSIHILTNDTGCVWRHQYDVESGHVKPFRPGYVNVACEGE